MENFMYYRDMNKLFIFFAAIALSGCLKDNTTAEDMPTFTYNAVVYGQVTGCHDLLAIEMLDDADTFPYPLDSIISNSPDNRVFAYNLPDSLSEPGLLITVELEAAHGPFVYYGPECWGTSFLIQFCKIARSCAIN